VVSIFGENLDLLDSKAKEVASVLAHVPGSADVQVKSPPGSPRLVVRLRQDRLAPFGYRPMEVLEAIQAAYRGIIVAQTHRGRQVVEVAVVLEEHSRNDPGMVKTLLVRNAS